MEDLTGKQFGAYQIISPFGEGGMATVYKAYQPSMDRFVALKVLPRFHSSDPEFLGRFEQEAKALAQLQHPHILPVYDYGESEGYTYFVMPLMEVGNLAEFLTEEDLSLEKINQIISQVGTALEFAHSRGFIHRDVKPSNILLDESGNCMLMDFGIAKIIEGSKEFTRTGGILGTPAYMSPEQGSGNKKVDHKSDIYSLGIILYEMVTGRPPFEAETPVAIIFKHVHDPLPPPSSIKSDLAEDVERVILKSLAKDPNDRYGTVRVMVDALSGAVTRSLGSVSQDDELSPTLIEVIPAPPSDSPEVSIPEPAAEEIPVRAMPEKVVAAEGQTTPLSKTRWFRPMLIFVGAIALILVGVWLTSSGILSADDKTDVVDTESVAGLSTEIPQATNTSAAVFVQATAPVTDTLAPPSSTVTSEPPPEPAYPAISTSEGPGMGLNTVVFLGFDGVTPPFNNVLVRRAIASSIDRVGLINVMADLLPNYTLVPATNYTPPDYLGFDLYGEVGHPFDLDRARQFMAEAGYPNGEGFPAITLFHGASEGAAELARQVSEDLNGFLGISVNVSSFQVNYLDLPAFYTIGWRADYINPHSFLYDPFCGNYNAEFLQSDEYSEMADSINVERNFDIRADKIREFSDTWCDGVWDPHINLGQEYKRIVDQALEERDFGEARMLYVEAEIMLVETEAFIVPLYHRTN